MGGSKWVLINHPVNLVVLCSSCHAHVESYRTEAYEDGWLLRSQWGGATDPNVIPLPRRRRAFRGRDTKGQGNRQLLGTGGVEASGVVEGADSTPELPF